MMAKWSTTPPRERRAALVEAPFASLIYEVVQWEPRLRMWMRAYGKPPLPPDTPWHPLPWPADGRDLSATHELEDRRNG